MFIAQVAPSPSCDPVTVQIKLGQPDSTNKTVSASFSITASSPPPSVTIQTDNLIDLSGEPNCVDFTFKVAKNQDYTPNLLFGQRTLNPTISNDPEFHSFTLVPDGDTKNRTFNLNYLNTGEDRAQGNKGNHKYSLILYEDIPGHIPRLYTIDPKIQNKPPQSSPWLALLEIVALFIAGLAIVNFAARLFRRRWTV